MTQHTPGPWEVWSHDNDPRHVYVGPVKGGLCVAAVVSCNAHGVYTPETEARGLADAYLIAAAHDLLEFAKAVVRYAGSSGDDYLADKARAAIKKAEMNDENK